MLTLVWCAMVGVEVWLMYRCLIVCINGLTKERQMKNKKQSSLSQSKILAESSGKFHRCSLQGNNIPDLVVFSFFLYLSLHSLILSSV